MRRDAPYAAYNRIHMDVVTRDEGDVWARTLVRRQELLQSIRILRQVVDRLPSPAVVRQQIPHGPLAGPGRFQHGREALHRAAQLVEPPGHLVVPE